MNSKEAAPIAQPLYYLFQDARKMYYSRLYTAN